MLRQPYIAQVSSSIGLTIATKDHFLVDMIGIIPTSQTIFSYSTLNFFHSIHHDANYYCTYGS